MEIKPKWICTDIDQEQYGRQLSERVFEFKQKGLMTEEVNLDNYTEEQITYVLSSYGYTREGLMKEYEQDAAGVDWIIAECIYELYADWDEEAVYESIRNGEI